LVWSIQSVNSFYRGCWLAERNNTGVNQLVITDITIAQTAPYSPVFLNLFKTRTIFGPV